MCSANQELLKFRFAFDYLEIIGGFTCHKKGFRKYRSLYNSGLYFRLFNKFLFKCLDDLINIHKKGVNEEQFNDLIQEKFVTALSNGAEVELCKNGKNLPVTYDQREEYAILVESIRLKESIKQIQALKNGLT